MGDFSKEKARIGDCVRLNLAVPDLNAARNLPLFSIEAENDHKDNSVRRKWILYAEDGSKNLEILQSWKSLEKFIADFPAKSIGKAHISEMPPESLLLRLLP